MKTLAALALTASVALVLSGCDAITGHSKSEPEPDSTPSATQGQATQGQAAQAPQGQAPQAQAPAPNQGIQQMTPSAVPNAPVYGGQNLQGSSGGGVGAAARDMARRNAGTARSSLDQMGGGE